MRLMAPLFGQTPQLGSTWQEDESIEERRRRRSREVWMTDVPPSPFCASRTQEEFKVVWRAGIRGASHDGWQFPPLPPFERDEEDTLVSWAGLACFAFALLLLGFGVPLSG